MLYIIRGVWGVEPQAAVLRSSLSLIPIFRPLQVRATPAVFPAVIRGLPLFADCPVRQLAIPRSSSGLLCYPAIFITSSILGFTLHP